MKIAPCFAKLAVKGGLAFLMNNMVWCMVHLGTIALLSVPFGGLLYFQFRIEKGVVFAGLYFQYSFCGFTWGLCHFQPHNMNLIATGIVFNILAMALDL